LSSAFIKSDNSTCALKLSFLVSDGLLIEKPACDIDGLWGRRVDKPDCGRHLQEAQGAVVGPGPPSRLVRDLRPWILPKNVMCSSLDLKGFLTPLGGSSVIKPEE